MNTKLYTDVHVRRAVVEGLRLRGVDVLRAQEDGAGTLPDPALLDRTTELQRVLFTQDDDLLREAKLRQQTGVPFSGVIYAHQLNVTIKECIEDLMPVTLASAPEEWLSRVECLPLK